MSNQGEVLIYDFTIHPFEPNSKDIVPQMRLETSGEIGWGLDWSQSQHILVSSDDDGFVRMWDLEKSPLVET